MWAWKEQSAHINLKELRSLHVALLEDPALKDCKVQGDMAV